MAVIRVPGCCPNDQESNPQWMLGTERSQARLSTGWRRGHWGPSDADLVHVCADAKTVVLELLFEPHEKATEESKVVRLRFSGGPPDPVSEMRPGVRPDPRPMVPVSLGPAD